MPRERKKPDFDNIEMGLNPLSETLSIPITKRVQKVLNKFKEEDEKVYDLESTPYTKVFAVESASAMMMGLPIRSKELYLYIIHALTSAKDYLWIDRDVYMEKMGITSINTYKAAVKGLSDALYIYPHVTLKDVFWINPYFFFRGSRIHKYPGKLKVKETKKSK